LDGDIRPGNIWPGDIGAGDIQAGDIWAGDIRAGDKLPLYLSDVQFGNFSLKNRPLSCPPISDPIF
jgi:hypothetical protein